MNRKATLALIAAAGCCQGAAVAQSRAETNYQRLLNGQVQFSSLTPEERHEVSELDRLLRSIPASKSTQAERCWHREVEKNEAPSQLAQELIELRCGERPQEDADQAAPLAKH